MLNNQKHEPRIYSDGSSLDIHSIFQTIQGEGPFSGTPAVFIRLAGCNFQCPNCDTDYTSNRVSKTVNDICGEVASYQEKGLVVITGGEPFRQNIFFLVEKLKKLDYFVQIETNGSIAPNNLIVNTDISERKGCYIVVSPKSEKIHAYYNNLACAFKYVLNHNFVSETDGLPTTVLGFKTKIQVARPSSDFKGLIYLTPEDSNLDYDYYTTMLSENEKNVKACIDSCLKYGYILNLQIHKIIGLK
jgi:7-carboxy-7-deazaguanine synthase